METTSKTQLHSGDKFAIGVFSIGHDGPDANVVARPIHANEFPINGDAWVNDNPHMNTRIR